MTPSTEQPDGCLPQDAFAGMAPIFQVVMEKEFGSTSSNSSVSVT